MTHQIEDRIKKAITAENKSKEAALQKQQREIEEEKQKLEEAKQNSQIEINKQVAEKIGVGKAALWKQAQAEADQQKGAEVKLLAQRLAEKDTKLREANAQEIALRKEKINSKKTVRFLSLRSSVSWMRSARISPRKQMKRRRKSNNMSSRN